MERRVSGFITAVSSSVAWLASWNSPSPSMSTGISPLNTRTGEASVFAAATAVAMLQRPGPPIPITAPKRAARAGIAVGHVSGAALVRGNDRRQFRMTRQRRQKRIDQSAGNQKKMSETFLNESAQNEI